MALDNSVEVLKVGKWSVRRIEQRNVGPASRGLIYVHLVTGNAQEEPPREVLEELDMLESKDLMKDLPKELAVKPTTPPEFSDDTPLFRRIVLGNECEVPLTMARDIVEALHEDVSLFQDVQRKFSDFPKEPPVQLDELLKSLEMESLKIERGEVSDILQSLIGVQILLRVA